MKGSGDEASEETSPAKPAHDSGAATKAEYGKHILMHRRYRAWCHWCATGRGRNSQHRRAKEEGEERVPVVAMYSCLLTVASTPVLCLKCPRTGVIAANAVTRKDVTPELVSFLAKDIDNTSHTSCCQ